MKKDVHGCSRMIITEARLNNILKVYLVFIFLELFLMGSGQLIRYQSLTLRMINFIVLTLFCLFLFRQQKIKDEYLIMLYVYIVSLLLSSVIGLLNGASLAAIFNDVKPLLFFIYLIPFSFLIKTPEDIERIIRLLKICAIILSLLYFIYLIIYLFYPIVMFALAPLDDNGEIFFRENGPFFFYKGFFFIMVTVFLINKRKMIDWVILSVLLLAIFFTLTRGFYVALVVPYIILSIIHLINFRKVKIKNLFLLLSFFILLAIFLPSLLNFLGNRSESNSLRLELITNVNNALTPLSMIFGHGFGVIAGVDRVHLEISYYEILHKQGIIGLVVWMIPLIYCFKKLIKDRTEKLDKQFFLAVLSVYVLSLTNPFINNPLGISILVISMISMDILYKNNQLAIAEKEIAIGK